MFSTQLAAYCIICHFKQGNNKKLFVLAFDSAICMYVFVFCCYSQLLHFIVVF